MIFRAAWRGCSVACIMALLPMTALAGCQKSEEPKKPDAGAFTLTIGGAKAGTSKFKMDADGNSEADASIAIGGQSQKFKVTVKKTAGKITTVGADAGPSNNFTLALSGGKAKVTVNGSAIGAQDVPAAAMPFGNFTPHLMNYVLAAYDAKKGGTQPVTLILAEGLPNGQVVTLTGKLTSKSARDQKIAGKTVPISAYELTIEAGGSEIPMKLYANSDRQLLAWNVPSQSYTAVREGFEDVLKIADGK